MQKNTIVRGTTPTIIFRYSDVNVSEITTAFLTIKQSTETVISRDISTSTADVEANTLEWTLTQEETLNLNVGSSTFIVCDWVLGSGTRGRSQVCRCEVEPSGKNTII